MRLNDLRRRAKEKLRSGGIDDGDSSKLELLFEHAFGFSRNFILSEPGFEISEDDSRLQLFNASLTRVINGEPVQYVTGFSYFCGNKFIVDKNVLIPRQETELLVSMARKLVDGLAENTGRPAKVLDLCSGSGAIGISLKKLCPSCSVTLSDVSSKAVEVSKQNAKAILGSVSSVRFVTGSFLNPFLPPNGGESFDLILSNPPYVATEEMNSLPRDVKNYEPRLALDGGPGGLVPYTKIIKDLASVLVSSGTVIFEIGETQGEAVRALLYAHGFKKAGIVKDLDGKDRFVFGSPADKDDPKTVKDNNSAPEKPELTPRAAANPAALLAPVSSIKGVGPKTEAAFKRMGINNCGDLLKFYPSRYENRANVITAAGADALLSTGGSRAICATMKLRVISLVERGNPASPVYVFTCGDSTGSVEVVFFNNRYVKNLLKIGRSFWFYGKIVRGGDFFGRLQMHQPVFADASNKKQSDSFLTVSPVYRTSGKPSNKEIISAVRGALEICGDGIGVFGEDTPEIPDIIREKYRLAKLDGLIRTIHFPADEKTAGEALSRIEFEKLLNLTLCIQALKNARSSDLRGISFQKTGLSPLLEKLPFTLTGSQKETIERILDDMASDRPMNRLINGDVGSGKTVVALAAVFNAVANGFQAAFMVPSTVLAAQHMGKLSSILRDLGVGSEILFSSTTASERRRITKRIESGESICVIGTHSLIQDNVSFKNLGLVVIDEQHRFGVAQRASLIAKSSGVTPDVLSLTATPIPRSLALILYGDMDISVLSEKPAGRIPVATYHYEKKHRPAIYKRALEIVKAGGQAYIVHAKIDKNDDSLDDSGFTGEELLGCVENFRTLSATVFHDVKTGIIHGKMKDSEKKAAMDSFASGETKVLFATTVIEVGVDVPAATLMIIENAERFGLSTLHQLRGRVGRGSEKSYCILISDKSSDRLDILTETNDGFKIAERDLELRGPGDFFGTAQTGMPEDAMSHAAMNPRLLEQVRAAADDIILLAKKGDPQAAEYYKTATGKVRNVTL